MKSFGRSIPSQRPAGLRVEAFPFPKSMAAYQALIGPIVAREACHQHHAVADDPASPLDPDVRQRSLAGGGIDDVRDATHLQDRAASIAEFKSGCACVDIVALPGIPLPASPVSTVDVSMIPLSRSVRAGNGLDLCRLSIPTGVTVTGLPAGLQLMAWSGADAKLLDFAHQVSQGIGS